MTMFYLASPYSSADEEIKEHRYKLACIACAQLVRSGKVVYSPIVQCHSIAKLMELPTGWDFWKDHCAFFISCSEGLIVLKLDGWESSVGVAAEVEMAE